MLRRPWDAQTYKVLQAKGVVANGTSDDSGALQEAILSRLHGGRRTSVRFPHEIEVMRIDSGIAIPFVQASVEWDGIELVASGMSSGPALSLVGQALPPYNIGSNVNVLRGLVLTGPDTDATLVDGIKVGGDGQAGFSGHGAIDGVLVRGFRDNLVIDDNFFIAVFRNFHSMYAHRYGLHYTGDVNTGESINFEGGGFLDCQNAGGTAIGVYVPSAAAGPDLFFRGTSFSYDDVAFDVQCGAANFVSCHFENETENPMGRVHYVGGRPSTKVMLFGGSVSHGTLLPGTLENAAGRPVMFAINAAAGDRCAFTMRGVRYGGFGKYRTQLVEYTGAGNVQVVCEDNVMDPQGGAVGRVHARSCLIRNGGFEANIADGWTTTAGGATLTRDTAVFSNGTGSNGGVASLKIVAAAANTATLTQVFSTGIQPGRKIRVRGFIRCDAVSAGNLTAKLHWLDANGATISTVTPATLATAAGAWAMFSAANDFVIPAGAVSARLELACNAFTGTGYFDDVEVWVL